MKFVEYQESFGEYKYPEGFEETLEGLSVEQQLDRFRTSERSTLGHTGWRERTVESGGVKIGKDSDVRAVVVKDGKIVGLMINNDCGRDVFCGPEERVCTYYADDNNGAGSKTRIDYIYFWCVNADFDK